MNSSSLQRDPINIRYRRFFNDTDFNMNLIDSHVREHFDNEWPRHHTRRDLDSSRFEDSIATHRRMFENFHKNHVTGGFQGYRRLNNCDESSSASASSSRREDECSRVRIIPIQVIREPQREFCAVQKQTSPKFTDVDYISDESDYDDEYLINPNRNNNGVRNLQESIPPTKRQPNSRHRRTAQGVTPSSGRHAHQGNVVSHRERLRPTDKLRCPPVLEINDSLTECFRPSAVNVRKCSQNGVGSSASGSHGSSVYSVESSKSGSKIKSSPVQSIQSTPGYPLYAYLKSRLDSDGRQIDYIQGDGNCFFRALSKEIYGQECFHAEVRQAVMDVIEKYPREFEQFLDSDATLKEHIHEMRLMSTWSTTMEIYAAATLLQRDVYVLSPDHTGYVYNWLLFKPRFVYNGGMLYHPCYLTLCHTNGNHYDRIAAIREDCNCKLRAPKLTGVESYVDLTDVELSVC